LEDEQLAQMGIKSVDELAEMLGVPAERVTGMSLAELVDQVEAVQASEYRRVQSIQQQLADPNLGAAERDVLLNKLRDLGGVGLTGVEQQMESLADVVGDANVVEVGGRQMSWEEFLSDDNLSQMVEEYLSQAVDEETRASIEQAFGEDVVDVINQHSEAFRELVGQAKGSAEQFQQIEQKREKVRAPLVGGPDAPFDPDTDKELLDRLFPGWDEAGVTQYDWAGSDLYEAVAGADKLDATLDYLFGEDVDVEDVQSQFDALTRLSQTSPGAGLSLAGNQKARQAIEKLKTLVGISKDGQLEETKIVDALKKLTPEQIETLRKTLPGTLKSAPEELARIESEQSKLSESAIKDKQEEDAKQAKIEELDKQMRNMVGGRGPSVTSAAFNQAQQEYEKLTGRRWRPGGGVAPEQSLADKIKEIYNKKEDKKRTPTSENIQAMKNIMKRGL
jgi:hypothetical protein